MLVKRLRQRGDTIVEVMIVLAVLGSAIGISYTTANRSLLNARQAQENAEAAKLAQAQLEALYVPAQVTNAADTAHYLYRSDAEHTFCMQFDSSGQASIVNFPNTGNSKTQRNLDYDSSPGDYPAACTQGIYHYSIRYNLRDDGINYDASAGDTFTVVVVWDDALGQGKDTVTLTYRLHPPVERDDI